MNACRLKIALAIPLLLLYPTTQAAPVLQEFSLHTMLEASAGVLTTLGDYSVLDPDHFTDRTALIGAGGISWTGSYSSSGWSYTGAGLFGGASLSMAYSGAVSGSYGSGDIVVSINGTGMYGTQPLLMNGSTTWYYDAVADDYLSMDFAQETKIGSNSWWGWLVGRENVYCLKEGVAPRIIAGNEILVSAASSGKPSAIGRGSVKCLTPLDLAGNTFLTSVASSGKKGSMAVSVYGQTILQKTQHVKPGLPAPLVDLLDPGNQGTLVTDEGGLFADDRFNRYRSSGRYSGDDSGGNFSGLTTSIPEPSTVWLVCLAACGLLAVRRRNSRIMAPIDRQLEMQL